MRRMTAASMLIVAALLSFSFVPSASAGTTPSAAGACVTSDLNGNCGPYNYPAMSLSNGYNTYVGNDGWACGHPGDCGPQTLTVNDPGHWNVVSNQRAGNTGVLTYPNVSQVYTDTSNVNPLVSSYKYISSSYQESMPAVTGLDAEAGYDIWLSSTNGPNEVMIWVDNVGRGTGGARHIGTATIAGVKFDVLEYGTGEVIFSLPHNLPAGSVHILWTLHWLQWHGLVSKTARVGQIDFGWEICSTGGKPAKFTMSRYTLHSA